MFKATIRASKLEQLTDAVSTLVDECRFTLSDEGIQTRAVDPANVGMVDSVLKKEAFEQYDADGGVVGIHLTKLENFADMADSDDLIQLELDEETRKLHIQIGGFEGTMALIDPDNVREEPDIPDLDLNADVTLYGSDINRAVKAADMVSDHVALGVDADEAEFYVDAKGDTDDVHLEIGEDELVALETDGDARSLFSLGYLKDMNKAIEKDTEVRLELGEEFPVKMHFANDEDGHSPTTFMLAPRIQND